MTKLAPFLTALIISMCSLSVFAKKFVIKVPKVADTFYNDDYNIEVLKLALSKAKVDYQIQLVEENSSQERIIRELEDGENINLYWMGASRKNSNRLLEVPIPLFRGLLGHRIFLIHKDDEEVFENITTLEQLQKIRGVVGNGWPDEEIMKNSSLPLVKSSYRNAFKLMNLRKRAEYFPRGSYEIIPELRLRKDSLPNIIMEKRLSLVYKYAVLFYVSPKNPKLAKLIHRGLLLAYQDGSFLKIFNESEVVRDVTNIVKIGERHQIVIPNPFLSKSIEQLPNRFWEFPIPQKDLEASSLYQLFSSL